MVKTYSYKRDGNTSLSPHFKVREFRSGDGADTVLIDTDLIQLLEALYTKLGCSKILITSGYRTAAYDKKVGGSGGGYHTKGQAADVNCYYKANGKEERFHGSQICCALQELGATGIGWIAGCAVHVDTRASRYWFDEQRGNRSIGNDWYAYDFGAAGNAVKPAKPVPPPAAAPDVCYMAYAGKWWSEITNCNDRDGNGYAGVPGKAITGLKARASRGHVRYRVHTIGGRWLPWVEDYQDYAGIYGRNIDCVQMELREAPGYALEYRVARVGGGYYSWIKGWNDKTNMGYAGSYGKAIDRIQCRVVKA